MITSYVYTNNNLQLGMHNDLLQVQTYNIINKKN